MNFRTLSICLLFFSTYYGNAQTRPFNIPLVLEDNGRNQLRQNIDLSKISTKDFVALSFRIEGNNINSGQTRFSISNGIKDFPLTLFGDIALDDRNIFVSDLIYLQPEDLGIWQFTLSSSNTYDLSHKIEGFIRVFVPTDTYPDSAPGGIEPVDRDITCSCPKPPIILRQEWGAQFGLSSQIYSPPAIYTTVTHLIVHHSAGTNTSNNWKSVVASIFDFHVHTNGWQDVGYNWLIDPNGIIYEGRGGGENVRGAHMCGYNNNTMGVCVLGNFELIEPKEAAIEALKKLLAYKACKENIDPLGSSNITSYTGHMHHISGHQEGCAPNYTMCPGKHLFSKLSYLRDSTAAYIEDNCVDLTYNHDLEKATLYSYPNPAYDWINLPSAHEFKIINSLGVECTYLTEKLDEITIDISKLPTGIYFIQNNLYKNRILQKLIKN